MASRIIALTNCGERDVNQLLEGALTACGFAGVAAGIVGPMDPTPNGSPGVGKIPFSIPFVTGQKFRDGDKEDNRTSI
jgi:hypothetical protein